MARIELQVPADVAYVGLARLVVTTAARRSGMEDGRVEDLKIAVSEATTNAILAFQRLERNSPVVLSFGPAHGRFEVLIHDAGGLSEPPGPEDGGEEGPLAEGGLGATVIRGLTDIVDFVRTGADRVDMRFAIDLGGENGAPATGG